MAGGACVCVGPAPDIPSSHHPGPLISNGIKVGGGGGPWGVVHSANVDLKEQCHENCESLNDTNGFPISSCNYFVKQFCRYFLV